MEILFITHKFPPSIGGMENQSFHLVQGISKKHKVHKIVFDGKGSVFSFYLSLKAKVKETLKQNPGIELIHCNDGTIGVICGWITKLKDVKTVVTLHGLDVVFPNRIFQNRLIKRLRNYDRIITVSTATKEECLKRDFDPHKVVVVPNGVDHDIAEMKVGEHVLKNRLKQMGISREGKRILISMGRAVKRKGFSWFIENVVPDLPDDILYLIIGPFKEKASLTDKLLKLLPKGFRKDITLLFGIPSDQEKIRRLLGQDEFKDRVIPLGKLPFKDLLACLSESDLFIMPNIRVAGDLEGFGLVALEACMRGTPVLAANIEGIQDAIIDGKNGFMIESGNPTAWKKAIEENLPLANDFERNRDLVQYTLDNYSWDMMVNGYEEVFQILINQGDISS